LTAVSPPHAAGPVSVSIFTIAGNSSPATFTYTGPPTPSNLALAPNHGPTTGNTSVAITGSNIASVAKVTVGGTAVPFTYTPSPTPKITIRKLFAHGAGVVPVCCHHTGGTGSVNFTYQSPPIVPAPTIIKLSLTNRVEQRHARHYFDRNALSRHQFGEG